MKTVRDQTWYPVYDVANYLMMTEPREGCGLPTKQQREAESLVESLNAALVTTTAADLANIPLVALAGGRHKVWAIYDTLQKFRVDTLITDDATAESLVELEKMRPAKATTGPAPQRKNVTGAASARPSKTR